MSKKKLTLLGWLGYQTEIDYSVARRLGLVLGFLTVCTALILSVIAVGLLVRLFGAVMGFTSHGGDSTGEYIRNLGLVLAAVFGAPFLVWRSIVAQRNANTAEQAQITDRINKAVLGLGSEKNVKKIIETQRYQKDKAGNWLYDKQNNLIPALRPDGKPIVSIDQYEQTEPNIEVRVGAIISLERIARDSIRDNIHIMDLLCTYIRENTRKYKREVVYGDNTKINYNNDSERDTREDIQAALSVIGKRGKERVQSERDADPSFRVDFRGARLDGVRARGFVFGPALLDGSSWVGADLAGANFHGAWAIEGCDFSGADFEEVNFDEAQLFDVSLEGVKGLGFSSFRKAWLSNINFSRTGVCSANFEEASLSNCNFFKENILESSFKRANLYTTSFYLSGLFGVDFTEVNNWDQRHFDEAFGIKGGEGLTILPEGAKYPKHWLDLSDISEEYDAYSTFEHEYENWLEKNIERISNSNTDLVKEIIERRKLKD